ncbi:MAG: hypothetical protein B6I28_03745 [Fusobacteriia bacterium 4572_132]|nr:MAG: hypothetical protein B6I28_03745 [Fusobacteriia bacterium 4572_132]
MGSYSNSDVIFLLKNINNLIPEIPTEEREKLIQGGKHYSEMLPVEYEPTQEYIDIFYESLKKYKGKLAYAVGVLSEKIIKIKSENIVLVSLARAGTPIGILVKRYIKSKFDKEVPHYSISIIRDRGIDENAINDIIKSHKGAEIVFIDGWTGKGTIKNVLEKACNDYEAKYNHIISSDLAVLADPCDCAEISGTKEDFLIPSSCLNSTISGLVSRTVLNDTVIGKDDYHGAKFYDNLKEKDLSNYYIDVISDEFKKINNGKKILDEKIPNWKGLEDIAGLEKKFGILDRNFIKPGVGETTRVLLRRVPEMILVKDKKDEDVKHIIVLAKEKKVKVMEYPLKTYKCCGLIKKTRDI